MSEIKVFVASSSRYKPKKDSKGSKDSQKVQRILSAIQSKVGGDIQITPWWETTNYKSAGTLLDLIKKTAYTYDIGIFILGKDEKLSRTNNRDRKYVPNSNVLIELGMFLILNKTAFVIKDNDTYYPSDINNSIWFDIEDEDEVVEGFYKTIEDYKAKDHEATLKEYKRAQIYYDMDLSNKFVAFHGDKDKLKKFETKALFVGSKGAYCWEAIENDTAYAGKYFEEFVNGEGLDGKKKKSLQDIFEKKIDNVISFGPGVGTIDELLMGAISKKCCYVPVDLNVALAIKSRDKIMNAGHNVNFAIVDDFEDNSSAFFSRLNGFLNNHENYIGKRNLFSMLGVTFSNLSTKCKSFFNAIKGVMDYNDMFLLDVIIYDGKEGDMPKTHDALVDDLKNQIWARINDENYQNLIGNSVRKKGLSDCFDYEKLDVEEIPNSDVEYQQRTSVEDTIMFKVTYPTEGSPDTTNILLLAKYYKYEAIKKMIENSGFTIAASAKYTQHHRGVFLLKKKKASPKRQTPNIKTRNNIKSKRNIKK